jgi:hypothetical protein
VSHAHRLLGWVLSLPGDDIQLPNQEVEFIEHHAAVLYPAIAAVVVVLLVIGIFRAWRTTDLDAAAKTKFKRSILQMMRSNLTGMITEEIAKRIGLDRLKTVGLLEEMQKDGLVESHTTTQRLTVWRVRGLSSA